MSTVKCRCLRFYEYGNPIEVIKYENIDVSTVVDSNQVLVRWLASPIHPSDINLIENVYWKKRKVPAFVQSECVGSVEKIGANVKHLEIGDHVLCLDTDDGICVELSVVDQSKLYKFDKRVDLLTKATFMANPPTAWMMLKNYVNLVPGDYILQNSANSGVGRSVIELAKAWGIKTINIVRNRPEINELKAELIKLGANFVFTEEEFKSEGRKFIQSLDRPLLLSFNGVGGRSALQVSSALAYGGTMVTYGGMSKQPHQVTTSSLVFNGINIVGVAMGATLMQPKNAGIRTKIFDELQQLCIEGKLHAPALDVHTMDNYKEAYRRTMEGKKRKQLILISNENKTKL
ncbi:PKS-ER domain-containing protein [Aphelenchoides bicaudatus]|nr:PKS-ER domain-containing protein [Aphelenchoides bicaudatus]